MAKATAILFLIGGTAIRIESIISLAWKTWSYVQRRRFRTGPLQP